MIMKCSHENYGYSLIQDLCTPLKPNTCIPAVPNMITTELYKFKKRKQLLNETIIKFVTKFKKKSEHCQYATNFDNDLLDLQLIWGLIDMIIKRDLYRRKQCH